MRRRDDRVDNPELDLGTSPALAPTYPLASRNACSEPCDVPRLLKNGRRTISCYLLVFGLI